MDIIKNFPDNMISIAKDVFKKPQYVIYVFIFGLISTLLFYFQNITCVTCDVECLFIICVSGIVTCVIAKIYICVSSYRKIIVAGKKYLKGKYMSEEAKELLVERFYNIKNNAFNESGYVEINDATLQPLVQYKIIGRGSCLSINNLTFDYLFQPYALDFLNKSIKRGKLQIKDNTMVWR